MKNYNSVLGKTLLAIIILQLAALAPLPIANASPGITIVVNQTTSTTPADYYFDNLTAALGFINGSSYDSVTIYVESGEYIEVFPNKYVLNNVTVIGRNALVNGNGTAVLRLVDSENVTFTNITFYNFSAGIQLENSSKIRFTSSNLTLMSLPGVAPLSVPPLNLPEETIQTHTPPRLKKTTSTLVPASYKSPNTMILGITLGGTPAILVNNTSNVVIEDTVLSGSYGGIFILNSTNVTIRNVTIFNMTGTTTGGGGIGAYNSNNILVDNVTMYNISYVGIYMYPASATVPLTGITVTNIVIHDVNYGIDIEAQNALIANISGWNIGYDFIILYGLGNSVVNISGSHIGGDGIYVMSNHTTITDIVFYNVSTGVDLDFAINVSVSEANITNATDIGIYFSFTNNSRATDFIIEDSNIGVYMEYAEDNELSNATFKNTGNWGTIELDTCFNISISDVLINVSTYDGIGLYYTNNTTVRDTVIIDALWPIYLWVSNNNSFTNINVTTLVGAYESYGIEIEESQNNSFSNIKVYNITDPDTDYLGVDYPVGIALFGNSSAAIGFSSIHDIYNSTIGYGVGILVNNSSLSFIFSTIENVSTGILSVNNSAGIAMFLAAISNTTRIGISLNESTSRFLAFAAGVSDAAIGVYSNNSNITLMHFGIDNVQLGLYLYNATNATLGNITVNNAVNGVWVINDNEYYGMNFSLSDSVIISDNYGIFVYDKSYASNISLDNVTVTSGWGIKITTNESHWGSPPPTNITIVNVTSRNVTASDKAGLFLWINETPVNINITNLTIEDSNGGLLLVGVGLRGGNTSITNVEVRNMTRYEALIIENSTNLTIRNLHVDNTFNNSIAIGVYLGNVSNILLENTALENINGTPVRIGNASNITLRQVYIENPSIILDYKIKGNATIHPVDTAIIPPPTGNNTPIGVYANVTLADTQSWIQLTYTYPTSLGYPIVKWMYYNDTANQWINMPTTIITLNSTHKLVITNHTGSTLLGVFGASPPVGGKLKLYTAPDNSPIITIIIVTAITLTTLTITLTQKQKRKQ